ncbi:hypothetical protein AN958_10984, partial [Leucoagaricus sp. SymC.cos]
AKLIAIFVQSCLWGAFAVMFVITYWTLVYNRPLGRPLNKSMLAVAILMFILATMQLGVNFTRVIRGLILYKDSTTEYWDLISERTQLYGSAMYICQSFIGDAVAVYRTYIVWSRRLEYIIVPSIIYAGSLVTGIGILVNMARTTGPSILDTPLEVWITSFFACTLVASVVCTLLISSRIWYLCRNSISEQFRRTFSPTARVIFESGSIYSGVLVALLVTYLSDSWFQYVLVDTGIVFSIIIVRIGLGVATDPEVIQEDNLKTPRLLWVGSGTVRQASHELSTFAASGDIEACKGGDSAQSLQATISNNSREQDKNGGRAA